MTASVATPPANRHAEKLFGDALAAASSPAGPGDGSPLPLQGNDDPVLVTGGAIDVFALQVENGRQRGVGRHLLTCGPGEIAFPLPPCEGLQIVAVPQAGARLASIDAAAFWDLAGQPAQAMAAARLVDRWLVRLSGVFLWLNSEPPTLGGYVAAGTTRPLQPGEAFATERDVVWCRTTGAGCLILGRVAIEDGRFSPLAGRLWSQVAEAAEITVVDSRSILRAGEGRAALAGFHAALLAALADMLQAVDAAEAERLAAQRSRLDADLSRIRNDLIGLVGARPPEHITVDSVSQHLFAAVRSVAEDIGVVARPPATVAARSGEFRLELEHILRASQLRSRRVSLGDGWWKQELGPLLASRADGPRPVALLPRRSGYVLEDPAEGSRVPVTGAVAAGIAPDAYMLYQSLPAAKLTLRGLVLFGQKHSAGDFCLLAATIVLASALAVLPPVAVNLIFGNLIPNHRDGLLLQLGVALVAVGAVTAISTWCGEVATLRIQTRLGARFNAAIWDRVLQFPGATLKRFPAPDLAGRVSALEGTLASLRATSVTFLRAFGTITAGIATMMWFDPVAAFGALALMGVLVVATALFAIAQVQAFKSGAQALGLVNTFLVELVTSIAKLRLAGAEERSFVLWGDKFTTLRRRLIRSRQVGNLFRGFTAGFTLLATAAIFAVIALRGSSVEDTADFMAFVTAFGSAFAAAAQLSNAVLGLAFQLSTRSYFAPLLEPIATTAGRAAAPRLRGAITVEGLSFRYPGEGEAVLAGVSFKVLPGQFVAVVGSTGSGKSTLLRLLLGMEQPQGGSVYYDDQDLRGLDPDTVRQQIGTVMQRPQLFSGSLLDNIRGSSDADDATVRWALDLVGLSKEIAEMPMGLQTRVGDGAAGFSGGQIQRLAIARTLVRQPPILLLDEATSALDNATQATVSNGLGKLSVTRIVVAHRLSTVARADRILVLDGGRIVESGTMAELMKKNGLFARMAARQLA